MKPAMRSSNSCKINYCVFDHVKRSFYNTLPRQAIFVHPNIFNKLLITNAIRMFALRGQFVSSRGALWAPRLTLVHYEVDNISKCVCLTAVIDIT